MIKKFILSYIFLIFSINSCLVNKSLYKTDYKDNKLFNEEIISKDIILIPKDGYDNVIIFLHGLGDSALGVKRIFECESYSIIPKLKIILLTAEKGQVSANNNFMLNSWFNILNYSGEGNFVDELDVKKSYERIFKFINQELETVNYKNIFIGGFSQGAAMALYAGLNLPEDIGGIIGISGFLFPFIKEEDISQRKNIPILIEHGRNDEIIQESKAKLSYEKIKSEFKNFDYKLYDTNHNLNDEMILEMFFFIENNIKNNKN